MDQPTKHHEAITYSNPANPISISLGGGGLACGLLKGMHRHGWHDIPLIAVETHGADVFAQSVQENHPVRLSRITSKATFMT